MGIMNTAGYIVTLILIAAVLLSPPLTTGIEQQPSIEENYIKSEHMIPMRDGVRLYTQVYTPKNTGTTYPILLTRTPYGVGYYKEEEYRGSLGPSPEFALEGFIFVYQDVRGKFRSEGEFIHHPPFIETKSSPKNVDESSDAYDTIEWLLRNRWE
jgi:putative CocE/NonD family hydrolase